MSTQNNPTPMTKQKTPLTELIEKLNVLKNNELDDEASYAFHRSIVLAQSLLPKEREMVETAVNRRSELDAIHANETLKRILVEPNYIFISNGTEGSDYYTQTFEQP